MPTLSLDEQFELLRVQIETAVAMPGIVVVSSACHGDGKSVTATGLASSLASAGYSTALLDASTRPSTIDDARSPITLDQFNDSGVRPFVHRYHDAHFDAISMTRDTLRHSASRTSVRKAFDALRAAYDFTIVDTAPILESTLGSLMASNATTTVIAVRAGRSIQRADRDLINVIDRDGIQLLGTIAVAGATIRDAARRPLQRDAGFRSMGAVESVPRQQRVVG